MNIILSFSKWNLIRGLHVFNIIIVKRLFLGKSKTIHIKLIEIIIVILIQRLLLQNLKYLDIFLELFDNRIVHYSTHIYFQITH